ncbi:MAG TPA: DUF1801 domain-containing protein [Acidobacteriota bacterium]|nr:DUF1801 domain-containing protein [Acidobacteriota bacterium]
MAELKTKKTTASVAAFLKKVPSEETRQDCAALVKLMKNVTRSEPKMWGPSIVGFGEYHYVYASGQEGDWPLTGFSPRKQNLTIYVMAGFDRYPDLMKKLGKCKTGKSCLYVKRLSDLDPKVLKELVAESVKFVKKNQKGC